jgi:cytochrome c biogenesis protein CcmG, thiol:disulfide interchange protein DsbE
MSPRSEPSLKKRQQPVTRSQPAAADAQKGGAAKSVAAVAGLVVLAAIIVYAVWGGKHVVPGAAVAPQPTASIPAMAAAGSPAPQWTVQSALGPISSSSLAGTPYLLEIFATWCPHCQRMTSVLRSIRAKIPASRLAMVSVTGSPYASNATPDNFIPENQQDVDAFDAQYSVSWPTIFDRDMSVARTWGLNGFPTIYVVDKKGRIAFADSGEIPEARLLAAIRKAGA